MLATSWSLHPRHNAHSERPKWRSAIARKPMIANGSLGPRLRAALFGSSYRGRRQHAPSFNHTRQETCRCSLLLFHRSSRAQRMTGLAYRAWEAGMTNQCPDLAAQDSTRPAACAKSTHSVAVGLGSLPTFADLPKISNRDGVPGREVAPPHPQHKGPLGPYTDESGNR